MLIISAAFWLTYFVAISLITVIDARTYRIPNNLVLGFAAVGLISVFFISNEPYWSHLAAAAAALAVGFGLYLLTGLGAGDAKFIAAVFLWLGGDGVIPFLFWFGVSCVLLVIILGLGRRFSSNVEDGENIWRPFQKGAPAPLALAIGPASILASPPLTALVGSLTVLNSA